MFLSNGQFRKICEQNSLITIVVHHQNGIFLLYFFDAVPPPLLKEEDIESIEEVEATAVARIAISPQSMPGIIKALQSNYERFYEHPQKGEVSEASDA
ncbi:MAG: hypothetical protein U9Q23_04065 [Candidatus Bipolaricaulota bacterium]|nr:hypothetical protein [Candidatus Bipolaricaulota bacterium]